MSSCSNAIKTWRNRTKARMIEAMGSACCVCGYSRCHGTMHFHHLDPKLKDFSLSSARANPASWSGIVAELRKCVMSCNRCHSEIHAGIAVVPDGAPRFNEAFASYDAIHRVAEKDSCPVCGSLKLARHLTCSARFLSQRQRRVDWSNIDLEHVLKSVSAAELSRRMGISSAAVYKRRDKLRAPARLPQAVSC